MSDSVAKGDELYAKAGQKLRGFSLFGSKHEDAAALLEKACNFYKLGKGWTQAAAAYRELAGVHLKLGSKHEAASAYVEGAKCAMKAPANDAVLLLRMAVGLYTDMGRLNMAARQLREIAEVQEKAGLKEEALGLQLQAADLFATENSSSDASQCKLKAAQLSAELERFPAAVAMYEEVARSATEHNLLRFSARGYLLQAGICALCYASTDEVSERLEGYRDLDPQFSGSREDMLVSAAAAALAAGDVRRFSTAVAEYDSLTRLDGWKTTMLLHVKRRLQALATGDVGGGASDDEVL